METVKTNNGDNIMILQVQVKNVYGNKTIYPVCEKAKQYCDLLGTKTFTETHIRKMKEMGYEFTPVAESI